jgi:hypothetical protein
MLPSISLTMLCTVIRLVSLLPSITLCRSATIRPHINSEACRSGAEKTTT